MTVPPAPATDGRHVISFSLWGNDPKYLKGAERNAWLAHEHYPGWLCYFYLGPSVPAKTRSSLRDIHGVVLNEVPEEDGWRGLMWRFRAALDPDVAVFISRDADSRLNAREAAAVAKWLASARGVHIMRDHPEHGVPILGGMWGARRGHLPGFERLLGSWATQDRWQTDQEFLAKRLYPRIRHDALVHDEIFSGRPFPRRRDGMEFVGESVGADGVPNEAQRNSLRAYLEKHPRHRVGSRARYAIGQARVAFTRSLPAALGSARAETLLRAFLASFRRAARRAMRQLRSRMDTRLVDVHRDPLEGQMRPLEGQMTPLERRELYRIVRDLRPDCAFEAGTGGRGGSTHVIAEALEKNRRGTLHTVEADEGLYDHARTLYEGRLRPLKPYVRFHLGKSQDVYPGVLESVERVDLALLDGAEDADRTWLEFQMFLPKLGRGSVLVCHDWRTQKMGRVRALLESDPRWECVARVPDGPRGLAAWRRVG